MNKEQEKTIIKLSKQYTYDEIAEIEGVSKSTIHRVLTKNKSLKSKTVYENKRKKIENLYKKYDGNMEKICKEMGMKYKSVYYYVSTSRLR